MSGRRWSRARLRRATLGAIGVGGVLFALWYLGWMVPSSQGRERRSPPTWLIEDRRGTGPAASFAPVGDGVLAVGGSRHAPQLRRPDGTWVELPHLPVRGSYGIMPLGDTALVYGHRCGLLDCDGGDFTAFLFDRGHASWRPVDWPEEVRIDSEVELWPMGSSARHAVLSMAGKSYVVDTAGIASELPDAAFGCVTADDFLLSAELDQAESSPHLRGVRAQALGEPDRGWIQRAELDPTPVVAVSLRCASDGLSYLLGDGNEVVYGSVDDRWSVEPSDLTRLLGRAASDMPGLWARSPSGGVEAFIGATDVVVRRAGGPWQPTGRRAWSIVATDDAVYALGPDDPDLVRVWSADPSG